MSHLVQKTASLLRGIAYVCLCHRERLVAQGEDKLVLSCVNKLVYFQVTRPGTSFVALVAYKLLISFMN